MFGRSTHFARGAAQAGFVCVLLLSCATAQETTPAQTGADELTVEGIQQRLSQTEQDSSVEEGLKTRLLDLYRQALGDLQRAADWAKKAGEFETVKQEAPKNLKDIRDELTKPLAPATPEVPADASLQRLEQLLAQKEAELKTARDNIASLDQERKRRADRRAEVPTNIAAAKQRLDEISHEPEVPPSAEEPPQVRSAKKLAQQSRKKALEEEIKASELEIASYDARGDLLTARRDKAGREVARLEQLVSAWQTIVSERRRTDAEQAAKTAERVRRETARSHPLVRKIAEENAALAKRRTEEGLADKIEKAKQTYQDLTNQLATLSNNFDTVKYKVKKAGLTHAMGLVLRRERERLPDIDAHRRDLSRRQSEMSQAEVELLELDDQRSAFTRTAESMVQDTLAQLDPSVSEAQRTDIESAVRELLQLRRDYLDSLIGDYESYSGSLSDLVAKERELIDALVSIRSYIDERILWIRSTAFPRWEDVTSGSKALAWVLEPAHWIAAARSLPGAIGTDPFKAGILAVLIVALLVLRARIGSAIRQLGEAASEPIACEFLTTVLALLLSILAAALWPLVLWALGWSLTSRLDASDFGEAVGAGLQAVAVAFFLGSLLRQICRPWGLGSRHFGWPAKSVKIVRQNLVWLLGAGLPMVFLVAVLNATEEDAWQNTLGRGAFVIGQLLLAIFAAQVLRPGGGALRDALTVYTGGWANRFRYVWYPVTVALPLALAVLACTGYYYTALRLCTCIHTSAWLLLVAMVLNAMALRWVLVSRRRLALEQARKEAAIERPEGAEQTAKPVLDLLIISAQTRNLIRTVMLAACFVGLWVVWDDVLPALGILENVQLWSVVGNVPDVVTELDGTSTTRWVETPVPVTLQDGGLAILILLLTFLAGRNVPGLLEIVLLQRLPMKPGERYAIATITKYTITVIGIVLACLVIGISWSKVQWLAAAMVVGLGFGLQEIFANFVSGLILLFERPIRMGDTVTVGDVNGDVTRIQIRATTIRDWDRKELVIPNKEFVTGQVINWTLSDSTLRVIIPVGIAYGSDTALAERLLYKVAREDKLVLAEPKPRVLFMAFGDSSLNFELRVFVSCVDHLLQARHQLCMAIDREFRKAGVEISFPQRDIHIRSIRDSLPIEHPLTRHDDTASTG